MHIQASFLPTPPQSDSGDWGGMTLPRRAQPWRLWESKERIHWEKGESVPSHQACWLLQLWWQRWGGRGGRRRRVQPVLPWPAEAMPALFLSSLASASLSMSFPTAQDKLQVPEVPSYSHFPSETSVADTFWVICLIKAQDICWFLVYVERWKEKERSSKSITDGQICKICFSHCWWAKERSKLERYG